MNCPYPEHSAAYHKACYSAGKGKKKVDRRGVLDVGCWIAVFSEFRTQRKL